jgi:hypothetical protein
MLMMDRDKIKNRSKAKVHSVFGGEQMPVAKPTRGPSMMEEDLAGGLKENKDWERCLMAGTKTGLRKLNRAGHDHEDSSRDRPKAQLVTAAKRDPGDKNENHEHREVNRD